MAELATLARPYAEAMFKAAATVSPMHAAEQLDALASVSSDAHLRQFAADPKVDAHQVFDLMVAVCPAALSDASKNLLLAVIDNGRLAALPEIAVQFRALANANSGVSDATIYSAYPIEAHQLPEVVDSLQRRFKRQLNVSVHLEPELIGGIRVVVGDEVLDTSVKARLEQMKMALTA